jgi:O-antigen/teichoic acid export membrane protein
MLQGKRAKQYLTSTGWMLADRLVRLAVVLVTGIFMARYLGVERFGQLNYASGVVGLFFTLTIMGLDEIVVRDLVRDPDKRPSLLGTTAVLKFLGALLLLVLVYATTLVEQMEDYTTALVMIIALAELLKPMVAVEYWFQARVNGGPMARVSIAETLLGAGYKLLLIYIQAPLMWFAWSYVIETAVMALGNAWVYRAQGFRLAEWRWEKTLAVDILRQSWPLIIYGVALLVQARIDQVMIYGVLESVVGSGAAYQEVGQYSVALRMVEALGFLPVVLQKSFAPAITGAKQRSPEQYAQRLTDFYRLMFLLFLLTAIPLYFLAEYVVVLLYGESYRMAGHLLALFGARLFFTNMGVAKTSFITNESLFKYSLLTVLIGATVNVSLNYFLIPTMRANGAIISSLVSFTVSIFIVDLFFPATRRNLQFMVKGILTFWQLYRIRLKS